MITAGVETLRPNSSNPWSLLISIVISPVPFPASTVWLGTPFLWAMRGLVEML